MVALLSAKWLAVVPVVGSRSSEITIMIRRPLLVSGQQRRGAVTVLAALLSIVLLGLVAFAVDIGYVLSCKEEMQRTADAAALAAAWDYGKQLSAGHAVYHATDSARGVAANYASYNKVGNNGPQIDTNPCNANGGGVVFGYVSDLGGAATSFETSDASLYNAVQVRVKRNANINGQVPLFFAKVFGRAGQDLSAEATAAIVRNVSGFQTSAGGGNIDLLPFALDLDTYEDWMAGSGRDDYKYNSATGAVSSGSDGWREVNLYPQGTGSPGNRGTVDIGGSNNSTSDIARQILHGISAQDLVELGKPLVFDADGELILNGDTGISAGVKDELAAIIGQPRVIPIFREVKGPGNNAMYTIVKWCGIRIVDVKLTGAMNKKHVTIQLAPVVVRGVVPSTNTSDSSYVYSPAVLLK
jgi:Flp pilus assembly protein TadG